MCSLQTKSAAALVKVSLPTVLSNSMENEVFQLDGSFLLNVWRFLDLSAGLLLSMSDCRGSRVSQVRQVPEGKVNIS